jgi:hypothetical protein
LSQRAKFIDTKEKRKKLDVRMYISEIKDRKRGALQVTGHVFKELLKW